MIEQTNVKKDKFLFSKAILIYFCAAAAAVILNGPFGKLYRWVEGPYRSDNIGVIFSEGADRFLGGYVWAYLFFIGLLVGLFIMRKVWLIWLIGFILLGWVSLWDEKYFLYSLLLSLLGFLIGKLILEFKKKKSKII